MSKTIVFDLDDTLYKEIDFLKSAFKNISNTIDKNDENLFEKMLKWYYDKENVFENLIKVYPNLNLDELKTTYRNHFPNLENQDFKNILINLKSKSYKLGLITDGYTITQKNKLKALKIDEIFDLIIISEEFGSEKPDERNFKAFHQLKTDEYFYIGDNTKKDFITPNLLNWQTICLKDNGQNIHKQDFTLDNKFLPKFIFNNLDEVEKHII
jgi:putative hydrolase of the HAD superfamily